MAVDVLTEIVIAAAVERAATYAADPSNASEWYGNIDAVEWDGPPLEVGSTMGFVARFLGRRLEYTYRVVELEPGRRLVMRTEQGPFPMETTYLWEPIGDELTRMSLRNRGEPSGFSTVASAVMAPAVRRANRADLAALKRIVEGRPTLA
jgi:hypothetical protein